MGSFLCANLQVGLVVDLTYTDKYYDGEKEFGSKGVEYIKIRERGHSAIPMQSNVVGALLPMQSNVVVGAPQSNVVGMLCTRMLHASYAVECLHSQSLCSPMLLLSL